MTALEALIATFLKTLEPIELRALSTITAKAPFSSVEQLNAYRTAKSDLDAALRAATPDLEVEHLRTEIERLQGVAQAWQQNYLDALNEVLRLTDAYNRGFLAGVKTSYRMLGTKE